MASVVIFDKYTQDMVGENPFKVTFPSILKRDGRLWSTYAVIAKGNSIEGIEAKE